MLLFKTIMAFLLLPGIFALSVPWVIAEYDPWKGAVNCIGFWVSGFGLLVLILCVRDFYVAGKGTLAPWSPPENLVTIGLYRYSRNPMYLAVFIIVGGCALLKSSPLVVGYLVFMVGVFNWRVRAYEEKVLSLAFPVQWQSYIATVSRWL